MHTLTLMYIVTEQLAHVAGVISNQSLHSFCCHLISSSTFSKCGTACKYSSGLYQWLYPAGYCHQGVRESWMFSFSLWVSLYSCGFQFGLALPHFLPTFPSQVQTLMTSCTILDVEATRSHSCARFNSYNKFLNAYQM